MSRQIDVSGPGDRQKGRDGQTDRRSGSDCGRPRTEMSRQRRSASGVEMRGQSQQRCSFHPLVGTGRSRDGRDWRPGFAGRPLLSPWFSVKVGIICEDKVWLLFAVGGMKTGRDAESTPCGSLLIGLITV